MDFAEIKQRLSKLDTPCLCDADKKVRVLDPVIRPVRNDLQLIGKAHTVRCHDDFLTVMKALQDATEDEVLVIDGQGGHRALAGELFTTEAARKKLAGIVVDGAVRDTKTILTLELPVYSRYVFPASGTTAQIGQTQIPISCGGITINPGDILFGDQDGIVVASPSELLDLIPLAEEIQSKEESTLPQVQSGKSLLDLLNFDEHFANISAGKESTLRFLS